MRNIWNHTIFRSANNEIQTITQKLSFLNINVSNNTAIFQYYHSTHALPNLVHYITSCSPTHLTSCTDNNRLYPSPPSPHQSPITTEHVATLQAMGWHGVIHYCIRRFNRVLQGKLDVYRATILYVWGRHSEYVQTLLNVGVFTSRLMSIVSSNSLCLPP